MHIEQIFSKQLTRNINGVVKAEQLDDESVYIELDEYVVTQELDRHFRIFFEAYGPAVNSRDSASANKNGVWVSGFFGSGKSHFIKILSYLLENRIVERNGVSRRVIDFFKEKITDAMLFSDIHSAVSGNTDVILFNIDSRANPDDRENAILKVFLKVFNERVGYCADYVHIAHLERELDKRDQYAAFKEKFAELTQSAWEEERDAYDFYRDELAEALAYASNQSDDSARQRVEQLESNFPLNIRNFSKWVKEYLDRSGDKNILFLVDEVGQFIGKNIQMMLQLQTIVENLGTFTGGRAWVVVTSQADIDAAIGALSTEEGQDFSKIQGRFLTRLQLSSSNTSEVIQKRLLEKTETAAKLLTGIYAEKGDILRNQLSFDKTTTAELGGYDDAPSFVDNYPFVPYHYPLVQKVFESIRTKGATGKHLAMGERSLLDAFQSAAKQIKDQDIDALVPFYCIYAPIESFLEPAVKRTIDQACELKVLTDYDNEILKTLFLIRYVDTVKSTLDNLVTLSIDHIDTDKISLKKQIEESLNRLERELLIARNGDEFIFLTNEEKEMEQEIRHTEVEPSEVSNKLSTIIFDEILNRKREYRYPGNNQDFRVSRFCNGHPKDGSTLEDLVVKVISPLDIHYESFANDQHCLNQTLEGEGSVLIKLGEHKRLWQDLTTYIQTERFLRQNSGERPEQEHLLREKSLENNERAKRLRHEFEDMFSEADVYAIGAKLQSRSAKPSAILEDAYKYVIENSFSKLKMLRPTTGEVLRELKAVLMADDMAQLGLDLAAAECNPDAVQELEQFISLKIERNEALYLNDLVIHFGRRPYGWPNNEILLLAARLGLAGKISFSMESTDLPLKKAYDAFTNVRKRAKTRILKIRRHDDSQLRKAAKLAKALFSKTFTGTDEKELYELVNEELGNWDEKLKLFKSKAETGNFPGKKTIEEGILLLAGLLEQSNSFSLIERFVEDADSLHDLAEDYEDLDDFYSGQIETWKDLNEALTIRFKANRPALEKDAEANKALLELERISNLPEPYGQIRLINPLIEKIDKINGKLIDERQNHALALVDKRIKTVNAALQEAAAPADLSNQVLRPLQVCKQRIEETQSIAQIFAEQEEAKNHEDDAYALINAHIEAERKRLENERRRQKAERDEPGESDLPENKKVAEKRNKYISTVKRTVTISPSEVILSNASSPFIETEEEVEQCLDRLREQLLNTVRAGDKVRIK